MHHLLTFQAAICNFLSNKLTCMKGKERYINLLWHSFISFFYPLDCSWWYNLVLEYKVLCLVVGSMGLESCIKWHLNLKMSRLGYLSEWRIRKESETSLERISRRTD